MLFKSLKYKKAARFSVKQPVSIPNSRLRDTIPRTRLQRICPSLTLVCVPLKPLTCAAEGANRLVLFKTLKCKKAAHFSMKQPVSIPNSRLRDTTQRMLPWRIRPSLTLVCVPLKPLTCAAEGANRLVLFKSLRQTKCKKAARFSVKQPVPNSRLRGAGDTIPRTRLRRARPNLTPIWNATCLDYAVPVRDPIVH